MGAAVEQEIVELASKIMRALATGSGILFNFGLALDRLFGSKGNYRLASVGNLRARQAMPEAPG